MSRLHTHPHAVVLALVALAACSRDAAPARQATSPAADPMCDAGLRAEYVLGENEWPAEIRLDVIYGRVRVGFTADQVTAAKSTRANRGGVAATIHEDVAAPGGRRGRALVYPDQTVILVDDKVAEIQPTKIHELR